MKKRVYLLSCFLFALSLFLLTGCSSSSPTIVGSGQADRSQIPIELSAGKIVGQTFTTRHKGLAGVEVYLASQLPGDGQLIFKLYRTPQDPEPVIVRSLPVSRVSDPGWYDLPFPGRLEQSPADFFFTLQIEGTGQVAVSNSYGPTYQDGSAYLDGQPLQDAQLSFQLVYNRDLVFLGLLKQGVQWLLWLGLAGLLFVLPGWVLLGALWDKWSTFYFGERLGLAIGLSLAFYPVLFLWTHLLGLQLGIFYAILPPGFALAFLLYKLIMQIRKNKSLVVSFRWPQIHPADLAYLVIVAVIFGVRFYIARPLSLPLWGDSYHHTVITQLLMDNKGLFQSWQPYAEMTGLTYHFGFHSLTAVFAWAAGLGAAQAVIWFGQILNGLAVLALYPLAVYLCRNRWAGVIAALVGGLLVQMPMFYINWGRYTQLAGQAILPAVMIMMWSALTGEEKQRKIMVLSGLAICGLALTHYRVLIWAVLFSPLALVFDNKTRWSARISKMVQIGVLGGLLFLPWFIHLYGGKILATTAQQLSTPAEAISDFTSLYNNAGPLSNYLPIWTWLLLGIALIWSLWRHDRKALFIIAWLSIVTLVANPAWLNLPGTGAINNFAILIAAYIPAGVFIGAAGGWLVQSISINRHLLSFVLFLGLIGIGLWGAKQRLGDAQFAQFTLAARPDMRASAWIQANLPQNASFLVNAFPAMGGTVVAGSDGGWWLRFLSGHKTNLPPILYSVEPSPDPTYMQSTNDLTSLLFSKGINDPEFRAELNRRGIEYIYLGQRQGQAGYGGPYPLAPETLLASPVYQPVYNQDRVWIFKMNP